MSKITKINNKLQDTKDGVVAASVSVGVSFFCVLVIIASRTRYLGIEVEIF